MNEQDLIDIVLRNQVLLEQYKAATAQEIGSFLPKVDKAIGEVLGAMRVDKVSDMARGQLRGLLSQLRRVQGPIYREANKTTLDGLYKVAEHVAKVENKTLGMLSKGKTRFRTPEKAWDALQYEPVPVTGELLESFVDSWSEKTMRGVEQAVMKAWGQGSTVSDLTRAIRGSKKLNYQDGLLSVSRRHAEAIARTSVQHVAQQTRADIWKANEDILDGWTFLATLDSRTTSQCRALDGKTFKLGEGPQPPVHVNCRSTSLPKLKAEYDFLEEGATRSSKDGYVDAKGTYYDWLKTQPEAFQNQVLGPTMAKVFRDGGISAAKFAEMNLGRTFKALTVKQMMDLEPMVFQKAGVTLSPDAQKKADEMKKLMEEVMARMDAEEKARQREAEAAQQVIPANLTDDQLMERMHEARLKVGDTLEAAHKASRATRVAADSDCRVAQVEAAKLFDEYVERNGRTGESVRKTLLWKATRWREEGATALQMRMRAQVHTQLPKAMQIQPDKIYALSGDALTAFDQYGKLNAEKAQYLLSGILRADRFSEKANVMFHGQSGYRANFLHIFTRLNMSNACPPTTWVHEFIHTLEYKFPEVSKASKAFLAKRAGGQAPRLLSALTGHSGYEAHEVAYEDEFKKRGGHPYMGKRYDDAATELLTMGAERLLNDPLEFAESDPDYFEFIIDILQGKGP